MDTCHGTFEGGRRSFARWVVLPFLTFLAGCGGSPPYAPFSPNELADIRSAMGEDRTILDITEYGPTLFVVLEYPREASPEDVAKEAREALQKIQRELVQGPQSLRPIRIWAHSSPGQDKTYQILGYAETDSASATVRWIPNQLKATELPVPNRG